LIAVAVNYPRRPFGDQRENKVKIKTPTALLAALLALTFVGTTLAQTKGSKDGTSAFLFADTEYFHRYTINDQHEFTPAGQENLKTWADMVTLHYYRNARDGDALASVANSVLGNYTAAKAKVIKTNSVPQTKGKPAEHLIVVAFGRPEFIEIAFSRFRMHEGIGSSIIYSHRVYGKGVGNEMSEWLKQNGATIEKTLMSWDAMPKTAPVKR
jgi:hypothetical protein